MFLFLFVSVSVFCSFALSFEFNVLRDLITWYSQSDNKINHVLFKFVFTLFRSSHQRCFIKKAVPKNFDIFIRKHLCWDLILIKVQDLSSAPLSKEILTQLFSCDYCESFKNTYLKNICERLLLFIQTICSNKRIVS